MTPLAIAAAWAAGGLATSAALKVGGPIFNYLTGLRTWGARERMRDRICEVTGGTLLMLALCVIAAPIAAVVAFGLWTVVACVAAGTVFCELHEWLSEKKIGRICGGRGR